MGSETSFKFFGPRTWGELSGGLKVLAVALLAFYVPLLMYRSVAGQSQQFYFMLIHEAVSVLLGLLMYKFQNGPEPSCVPARVRSEEKEEEEDARRSERRKAA